MMIVHSFYVVVAVKVRLVYLERPKQQISVSESEWNRSVLEVDEEFDKVKDVQSATVILLIMQWYDYI